MIKLGQDLERFVQQEVDRGHFPDRESVLVHAVRLLQQERDEALHGIRLGLENVANGSTESLRDAFADVRTQWGNETRGSSDARVE